MQSNGIVLQTVFETVGDALTILITLDEIFKAGERFTEHWTQYKRYNIPCVCDQICLMCMQIASNLYSSNIFGHS